MKRNLAIAFSFILLFVFTNAIAKLEQHAKLWTQGIVSGYIFKNDEQWKYLLDGRVKFIDDKYVFEQARFYYGLGYQLTPNFTPYFGGAYVLSKTTSGILAHENRIWEQINWDFFKNNCVNLADRTRFEQRKHTNYAQWAVRLREEISATIPIKPWPNHSFVVYDEIFFNLNHPIWVSNHFIAENRAFLGIETKLTKSMSFSIGYVNQYQFNREQVTQRSNIVAVTLNVNS